MKYVYKILMNGNAEFIVRRERAGWWNKGRYISYLYSQHHHRAPRFDGESRWHGEHPYDAYKFTDVKEAVVALQVAQQADQKFERSLEWSEVLSEEKQL